MEKCIIFVSPFEVTLSQKQQRFLTRFTKNLIRFNSFIKWRVTNQTGKFSFVENLSVQYKFLLLN